MAAVWHLSAPFFGPAMLMKFARIRADQGSGTQMQPLNDEIDLVEGELEMMAGTAYGRWKEPTGWAHVPLQGLQLYTSHEILSFVEVCQRTCPAKELSSTLQLFNRLYSSTIDSKLFAGP
jgi:hypothetical protein